MILRDKLKFWMALSNYVDMIVRGTSPLSLPDAIADSLSYVKAFGGTEQNGTPTPDAPVDIVSNNGVLRIPASAIGTGSQAGTPTPTTPIYPVFYQKGNLVLRAVDGYADTYDATTQTITRNVGVKVLDGTENDYAKRSDYAINYTGLTGRAYGAGVYGMCSHFVCSANNASTAPVGSLFFNVSNNYLHFFTEYGGDVTSFKSWLASQYAAGTPVIVYYPLATPITESFTPSAYADGTVETIAIKNNIFTLVGATYDETISANGNPGSSPNNGYSDYLAVTSGDIYNFSDRGLSGVALYDQDKVYQSRPSVSVGDYTIPAGIAYIRVNFRQSVMNDVSITHTNYTATAEMLLKVGDYQDVQSILDGVVTRNVGVVVLDGKETWGVSSGVLFFVCIGIDKDVDFPCFCTHYIGASPQISVSQQPDKTCKAGFRSNPENAPRLYIKDSTFGSDTTAFKQWLAQQYAAGTPVIVIYPLATPTTESVAGQTLQVTGGDNVLEITQASLSNLELEAQYKKEA